MTENEGKREREIVYERKREREKEKKREIAREKVRASQYPSEFIERVNASASVCMRERQGIPECMR